MVSRAAAEEAHRELVQRLDALGRDYGVAVAPSRIVARFDEAGIVSSLECLDGERMDLDAVRTEIEQAIAGRVPLRLAARPELLDSWLAGIDTGEGDRFTNDLGSVTIRAFHGTITSLVLDRRLLRGGRPQTICDEVLPVARRAMREADSSGRPGGER